MNSANVVPLCFRECIECRLFNSGRLADNQTCQRLCKDEIITLETLSKWTNKCTCDTLTGRHWLYVVTAQLGARVCSFASLLTYVYRATEQPVSPVLSSFQFHSGRDAVNSSQFEGVSATGAEGCLASLRRDRDSRGISLTDSQECSILAHMAVAQMFHVS